MACSAQRESQYITMSWFPRSFVVSTSLTTGYNSVVKIEGDEGRMPTADSRLGKGFTSAHIGLGAAENHFVSFHTDGSAHLGP